MPLQEPNLDQSLNLLHGDGAAGLQRLPPNSVKLIYGSPPYPNAQRDYGSWSSAEYLERMRPFLQGACYALAADGFLVINVKANREPAPKSGACSTRSLVVERLAIAMEEEFGLHCVDIEIWVKANPVPTGLRAAAQDAYEQNLWFARSNPWKINIDAIRREYSPATVEMYASQEYKPRANGLTYVRKPRRIDPNPQGALPINVITGGVAAGQSRHQARQPLYVPKRYILACTADDDLVADPWMGTGTTGLAATGLGRRFIGWDVEEQFVAMAYQNITGWVPDSFLVNSREGAD